MWNKSIRWTLRAVLVAGFACMFAVTSGCDPTLTGVDGFGSSRFFDDGFGGLATGAGEFSSDSAFDAAIIGLQGDLSTSCGGFGCDFDFGGF